MAGRLSLVSSSLSLALTSLSWSAGEANIRLAATIDADVQLGTDGAANGVDQDRGVGALVSADIQSARTTNVGEDHVAVVVVRGLTTVHPVQLGIIEGNTLTAPRWRLPQDDHQRENHDAERYLYQTRPPFFVSLGI